MPWDGSRKIVSRVTFHVHGEDRIIVGVPASRGRTCSDYLKMDSMSMFAALALAAFVGVGVWSIAHLGAFLAQACAC